MRLGREVKLHALKGKVKGHLPAILEEAHGQVGWMPRLVGGEESRPCNRVYTSRKFQPCLSRLNGMGGELHRTADDVILEDEEIR